MQRLFSFKGRTSRLGFWRVWFLCTVIEAAVVGIGYFVMIEVTPFGAVLLLGLAPPLVITIATTLRRLHDRGRNVWWLLLFLVGPFVSAMVAKLLLDQNTTVLALASLPFSLASLALPLWGWVEYGLLPGHSGANRFGEPPIPGR